MNIIIFITTYNRSEGLKKTLESICSDKDFFARNNIEIEVYDDKSDENYAIQNLEICKKYGVKYYTTSKNHGKERFWVIHKKIINSLSTKIFDYIFSLQDDYVYVDSFLSKTIDIFSALKKQDDKTICLNLQDNRIGQKSWNNHRKSNETLNINNIVLYKVGWIDCVYFANRKFFELLNFRILPVNKRRWKKKKNKSTGVGEQMSIRFNQLPYSIYQPKKPFITHTNIESQIGKNK